jgi:hypothetical protein
MTHRASLICALALALSAIGSAQTTTSSAVTATHYTQAQLKTMAREAHTPSQYAVLASYYAEQHTAYLAKAAEEKQEWDRRSVNIVLTAAKYPRPVDSTRYLYDYYSIAAQDAQGLAEKYRRLAVSIDLTGVN